MGFISDYIEKKRQQRRNYKMLSSAIKDLKKQVEAASRARAMNDNPAMSYCSNRLSRSNRLNSLNGLNGSNGLNGLNGSNGLNGLNCLNGTLPVFVLKFFKRLIYCWIVVLLLFTGLWIYDYNSKINSYLGDVDIIKRSGYYINVFNDRYDPLSKLLTKEKILKYKDSGRVVKKQYVLPLKEQPFSRVIGFVFTLALTAAMVALAPAVLFAIMQAIFDGLGWSTKKRIMVVLGIITGIIIFIILWTIKAHAREMRRYND